MPRAQKSKLESLVEIIMGMPVAEATQALSILSVVNRTRAGRMNLSGQIAPTPPTAVNRPPVAAATKPRKRRGATAPASMAVEEIPMDSDVAEPADEVITG